MRIQSISIVPEPAGCNARCKFCIAHMSRTPKNGEKKLDMKKLENALLYAKAGGAQTAILTSKGETLLSDWDYLGELLKLTHKQGYGQKDLYTNMVGVMERKDEFKEKLVDPEYGITNITMTVPTMDIEKNKNIMGVGLEYNDMFRFLRDDCKIVTRLSTVLNKEGVKDKDTMKEYIWKAKQAGAHQIVFRELWVPRMSYTNKVTDWSRKNKVEGDVARKGLEEIVKEGNGMRIFDLPWGETVYDVQGMNVTVATCDGNYYKDAIKSVVYLPDNHLYSSWECTGSIIM